MQTPRVLSNPTFLSAKEKFLLNLPFWIAASATALMSVLYTHIFRICEEWALSRSADPIIYLTAPLAILVSFLLGHYFSKEALGSGIPQVIASVELSEHGHPFLQKLLSVKMLLVKVFSSCVCVLGGGVVGREGPTLHVSAAIFYQLARIWPRSLSRPQLNSVILAGGAAGLASAFNTPLGGIVFAIEELSKAHISLVRTAVFQAVIIAGILAQVFLGNYLYLGDNEFSIYPLHVLVQTIIVGGIVGLVGGFFAESLYRVGKWREKKTFKNKILMTLACGALLSATIWACGPSAAGAGKNTMIQLLKNPTAVDPILPIARILGNFFTYTGGVVGGVFAPALSSGAALGQLISWVFGFASMKLMVLVGMVAFLTGITRTPFTSFVLVLEMSNSHEIILYLMLASVVANVAARMVSAESFYEKAARDIITPLVIRSESALPKP